MPEESDILPRGTKIKWSGGEGIIIGHMLGKEGDLIGEKDVIYLVEEEADMAEKEKSSISKMIMPVPFDDPGLEVLGP